MTAPPPPAQPPGPPQNQPAPPFVPLTFRPDARGPRPRSESPTLLTELPPVRPYTVPLHEPFMSRDLGRRRPSRTATLLTPSALAPSPLTPLHPPETLPPTPDVGRRPPPHDSAPAFL